jgi:hypothetical protein
MHRHSPFAALATSLVLLATGPQALAAGQVEVRFKPGAQLTDIGYSLDGDRNLQTLGGYFRSLAARLPDGQTLSIDVQDVDLAGDVKPWLLGRDMRVLRGRVDGPRLDLQWTLSSAGQTMARGTDRLTDMAYLMHPVRVGHDGPLPYEARLIDRWFTDRIGPELAH